MTHIAIPQLARTVAQEQLAHGSAGRDERAEFSRALWRHLAEAGLLRSASARASSPVDLLSLAQLAEELGHADAGIGISFVAHMIAALTDQRLAGSPLARRLAQEAGEGRMLLTLLDGHGSGEVTASPASQGGWQLTGRKTFVPHAAQADLFLCAFRTSLGAEGGLAWLEPGTAGLTVSDPPGWLGLRSSDARPVALEGLTLTEEQVLLVPETAAPLRGLADELMALIAAVAVGVAQAALDHARAHADRRSAFGQPIGHFPAIRAKLAEMVAGLELARAAIQRAAALPEAQRRPAAAAARLQATRTAIQTCDEAIQIHGGYGLLQENPVERLARAARTLGVIWQQRPSELLAPHAGSTLRPASFREG